MLSRRAAGEYSLALRCAGDDTLVGGGLMPVHVAAAPVAVSRCRVRARLRLRVKCVHWLQAMASTVRLAALPRRTCHACMTCRCRVIDDKCQSPSFSLSGSVGSLQWQPSY